MSEDVTVKFGLDSNPFLKGLDSMAEGVGGLKNSLLAMGAALGVVAVGNFVKSAIDMGDALQRTAEVTGLSVSELSKFRVAAELSDTSISTVATSMRFLQKSMVDAQDSTSDTAQVFRALGIDAKEALDMDPAEQLKLIGGKIAGIGDEATRTAVSMKVLGRSGTEMQPFFNEMERGAELAEKFGLTLSDDFGKRADSFNDNLTVLKLLFQDVATDLADALLPALVSITNAFVDGAGDANKFERSFDIIGNTTKVVASGFTIFLGVLKAVGQYLGGVMAAAVQAMSGEFKKAYATMTSMNMDWSDNIKDTSRIVNDMWDESANKAKQSATETSAVVKTSTEDQKRQYVELNKILGSDKAQRDRIAAEKKAADESKRIAEQAKEEHTRLVQQTTDEAIRINRGYAEFLSEQGKFSLADKRQLVLDEMAIVESGTEEELKLKRELADVEIELYKSIQQQADKSVEAQTEAYRGFFGELKNGFDQTVMSAQWWKDEFQGSMDQAKNFAGDASKQIFDGFGRAFADMIVDGKSFKDKMGEVFKDIGYQFVAMVGEMIAKWLAFKALSAAGIDVGPIGGPGAGGLGGLLGLSGSGAGAAAAGEASAGAGAGAAAGGAAAGAGAAAPTVPIAVPLAWAAAGVAVAQGLGTALGFNDRDDQVTIDAWRKADEQTAQLQAEYLQTLRDMGQVGRDRIAAAGDISGLEKMTILAKMEPETRAALKAVIDKYPNAHPLGKWFATVGPYGSRGYASGGSFMTNGPRMFLAGEYGPERITVSPAGTPQSRRGMGGDGASYVFNGPVVMDEITMRNFARAQSRAMALNGQRYAR